MVLVKEKNKKREKQKAEKQKPISNETASAGRLSPIERSLTTDHDSAAEVGRS